MKKHNKGGTHVRKVNPISKSSQDEKTAKPPHPSHKPQLSIALKWVAVGVVALLIVALIVKLSMQGKNSPTATGNKYADATTTLQNHISGKLPDDWFKPIDPASLTPRTYLYADVKNKAIVLVDEGKKDSIFYSRGSNNYDNISADSKSKQSMDQLRVLLNVNNFSNLDSVCLLIKADQTYLSRIKRSSSPDDQLLSLIYNTIVGDTAGHLYIAIEKNSLKAIQYDSQNSYRLNIDNLMAATRAVHYNPERYNGLTLKEVFEQHDVFKAAQVPPFVCLDYRNDCIRVTDGTVISGEEYFRWRDTLIENPSQLYLFKDNMLMVANVENINSEKESYGTIDKKALDRTVALPFDYKQLIPYLLLIFGLIEGVLIYSLLFGRKRNIPIQLVQDESAGAINIEEINKIKNIINNNTTMRSEELNILSGQLEILMKESSEYEQKRADIEKAANLTTLLSSDFIIEDLLNSIVHWWKDIDGMENKMERAKLNYAFKLNEDYLNTYKEGKEYKNIKARSDYYDMLIRCDRESQLLELLDQMRAKSNGKMAEINTFTTLKEKNPTIKEIVQMYDNQTKSNLIGKYEEMERKSHWYDKNSDSVVQPVEKARKSIATSIDRKQFVRSVFEDFLLPMFGKDYKIKVSEFLKGYLTAEDEARVYHLMMGSRSEFNLDGLKNELSNVVNNEDAEWLANMREIARRYSSINKFNETMWVNFVKEFVEKERTIDSDSEKGWFFSKVLEIAYHTADYIRSIKEPSDSIYCHNAELMANGLDMKNGTKEFDADNPMKNTGHAKKIFEWADELGVKHMKIVVDNYAIMP